MKNPIVLIHGYSDKGESFVSWKKKLVEYYQNNGIACDPDQIHVCSYRTLTNEVSVKDIAEAFDRALRLTAGLAADTDFDAIVHSTGMLVIRSWLVTYPARKSRLKRLIGLAPASFGSPLAQMGRSMMGAIFKGNKEWGPDFLEAGDMVLDALELGSRYTWDLACKDLVVEEPFYGADKTTPYVFILCGNKGYGGLRSFVNEPGTDGTVRWAGCSLNSRKIRLDLRREESRGKEKGRFDFSDQENIDMPVVLVDGLNHGAILEDPSDDLVDMVAKALEVHSAEQYQAWHTRAKSWSTPARDKVDEWQQFVFRATDERGDGIPDFNVQLGIRTAKGEFKELKDFEMDVHRYSKDPSYRCFHVNLSKLMKNKIDNLWISVIASSGTKLVSYLGLGNKSWDGDGNGSNNAGIGQVEYDITAVASHEKGTLFYPYTTTLVEIVLNREPMPPDGKNEVCWWLVEESK